MIPHKFNGKLLFLALIGIILYFLSGIITQLSTNEGMEEELGAPAVSREMAEETAIRFLSDTFGLASAADTAATYQNDKYLSGYIIRSGLSKTYEEKYAKQVPLDFWNVAVSMQDSGTLYHVQIGMDHPNVTAWRSSEKLPAGHEEKEVVSAQKALQEAGYDPGGWSYAADKRTTGNTFVFVSRTERVGDAPMQVTVGIKNGEAVSLKPSFQVPQSYMDYIKAQEKQASWMTIVSLLFTVVLGITALVYVIKYGRHISFVRGIFLTLTVLVLYLISNLNVADGLIAASGEAEHEAVIKVVTLIFVVIAGLLTSVAVWLCLLAGDQQWRMKGWNPWPRWRDADFGEAVFYGMGRGYLICLFILGAQQLLFLIAGNVFDSYAVNDPTQSILNMKWPYLFPALAWVAAIMEEILYRLFGIILFKKLLRFNFLAVLVPSVIWALGHTGYTLYPSYTRLFEVTVLGFVFGYTFLRYGLITAIMAHAIMDSLLMGLSLMLGDPSAESIMVGLAYIILPAAIGYVIRFLHPRFRPKGRRPGFPPPAEPRLVP